MCWPSEVRLRILICTIFLFFSPSIKAEGHSNQFVDHLIAPGLYALSHSFPQKLPDLVQRRYPLEKYINTSASLAKFVSCDPEKDSLKTDCISFFSTGVTKGILTSRKEVDPQNQRISFRLTLDDGESLTLQQSDYFDSSHPISETSLANGDRIQIVSLGDEIAREFAEKNSNISLKGVNYQELINGQTGGEYFLRCLTPSGKVRWASLYLIRQDGAIGVGRAGTDFVNRPIVVMSDFVFPVESDVGLIGSRGNYYQVEKKIDEDLNIAEETIDGESVGGSIGQGIPNLAAEISLKNGELLANDERLVRVPLAEFSSIAMAVISIMLVEQNSFERKIASKEKGDKEAIFILRDQFEFTKKMSLLLKNKYYSNQ